MSSLLTTFVAAIFLMLAAIALLGISYLFYGKVSWKLGSCGKDPRKIQNKNGCDTAGSCSLCSKTSENTDLKNDIKSEENESH